MSKKRQNYPMDSEVLGFFTKKYHFFRLIGGFFS